jgi:thiamine-phosphate pyrophosphorylase
MISKIQYISSGKNPEAHLEQIKLACNAGIKWVQLRLKSVGSDEYLFYACEARRITKMNNAVLIINDNLMVAVKSAADGIHLGKEDVSPKSAREFSSPFRSRLAWDAALSTTKSIRLTY